MKYLFDTNICIYLIKKHPPLLLNKVLTHHPEDICLSSITIAELWRGVGKSVHLGKNTKALLDFLSPFSSLDFDQTTAHFAGIIRANLEKRETPIGAYDVLIAATAKQHNLILVTNNEKEFKRIPGLKIENWTK